MAKKLDDDDRRKNKSFFHLIFPVLILALLPSNINGTVWYAIALKVLVFFWIYVNMKNFVESVYI